MKPSVVSIKPSVISIKPSVISNKPSVMFVDDEQDVLESLKDSLRKQPFEVRIANRAEAALESLAARPAEVVVSDEQMPGMPGHLFLAEVAQRHPRAVRILLTGQASLDAAVAAINDAKVHRFLQKPCPRDDLIAELMRALASNETAAAEAAVTAPARAPDPNAAGAGQALAELEHSHPGITHVVRAADGSIVVGDEPEDYASILAALGFEA